MHSRHFKYYVYVVPARPYSQCEGLTHTMHFLSMVSFFKTTPNINNSNELPNYNNYYKNMQPIMFSVS